MVLQVYAPTINAEEGEFEWFYEGLQDLLVITLIKHVLFIIVEGVGSQVKEVKKHRK